MAVVPGAKEKLSHDLGLLVDRAIANIVQTQQSDGTLGPEACGWQFGTMNAIRSLLMYSESPVGNRTISPEQIGHTIIRSLQQILTCFKSGKGGGGTRWPSYLEAIIDFMDAYPEIRDKYWHLLANLTSTWRESGIDWGRYFSANGNTTIFPAGSKFITDLCMHMCVVCAYIFVCLCVRMLILQSLSSRSKRAYS